MRRPEVIRALKEINELLKTREIPDHEIKGSRIDHNYDLNKFHVSVVFNEECFRKIITLGNYTKNTMRERGTFFYGRIVDNSLYIDSYLSDFDIADGEYLDAAVTVTEKNISELRKMTEKTEKNKNPYNVVIHFHTHPTYGITPDYTVYKCNTTRYSDQDYYALGYLQKYYQPVSVNFVIYTGGLLALDDHREQLSMVYYDLLKKDFFNIENIYYIYNDHMFKFNNYNITRSKRIEDSSCQKLMKSIKELQ